MRKDPYRIFAKAEERRARSRFLEAVPLYIEALRLSSYDRELKMNCSFSLGDTYRMVGEFARASVCYREAAREARILDEDIKVYDALIGLGLSLRAQSEAGDAIRILKRCLEGYGRYGDRAGRAFALWALGGALRIKGEINRAIRCFRDALALFQALRDPSGRGYCLTGLGGASRVAGRAGDSLKYYRDANRVFRRLNDTFGIAYSYCGIANALRMKGDFKGALSYFKEAKREYRKIGDRVSYAYTLWGEGTALQMLGRDVKALKDFHEAGRLFKETKDRRGAIYCSISVGQLLIKKGGKGAGRGGRGGVRMLKDALKKALALGLKVEADYSRMALRTAVKNPEALPLNLA